jgi:GSCFA family
MSKLPRSAAMLTRVWTRLGSLWDRAPVHPLAAKLQIAASLRAHLKNDRRVTVTPRSILSKNTKVFAIGSCFAVEIRNALRLAGYDVYPKYRNIRFDPRVQQAGHLPARDNVNHYDTFAIRQEIERAVARAHWPDESLWKLTSLPRGCRLQVNHVFQDPLRRHFYASSIDQVRALRYEVDRCIDDGLAGADVVIITLGLTECWREGRTGLYACIGPESEDSESFNRLKFHASTFEENRENLSATLDSIRSTYPEKKIVLTVSPVRLHRTWSGEDIVVANAMSKATLRAVAGEICRSDPSLLYWPSFELSTLGNIWNTDGVHVRSNAVRHIVSRFVQANGGTHNRSS